MVGSSTWALFDELPDDLDVYVPMSQSQRSYAITIFKSPVKWAPSKIADDRATSLGVLGLELVISLVVDGCQIRTSALASWRPQFQKVPN
jgi:hypothetical protein